MRVLKCRTDAGELGEGSVTAEHVCFNSHGCYASGREVPIDLITAHKWFNVAAHEWATPTPLSFAARLRLK